MTEPLARGELLALAEKSARMLKAIHLRVEMSNDWRLSEGEHAVLDTAYDTLLKCATIIRPAPARCDAGSVEALEWYADSINCRRGVFGQLVRNGNRNQWVPDNGDRARAALSPDPGTVAVASADYCTPDGPANCEAWDVDKRCPSCPVTSTDRGTP